MSIDLGRVTGLSAYEVWKKQPGNSEKTEQEFFQSLKGRDGEPGQPGQPGQPGADGKTPQITMRIDENGHLLMDVN